MVARECTEMYNSSGIFQDFLGKTTLPYGKTNDSVLPTCWEEKLVRDGEFDLIILSVELPRVSGYSVCNKLKKDRKAGDECMYG